MQRPAAFRRLVPLACAALLAAGCGGAPAARHPATAAPAGPATTRGSTGGASPPPQAVTVAYSQVNVALMPLFVGLDKGFFTQQGLDVKAIHTTGGSTTIAALVSGQVDLTVGGAADVLGADASGMNLVMVANEMPYPVFSLYVGPGVKSPRDLVGKKVGVNQAGGLAAAVANLFLAHEGLTGKVQLLNVGKAQTDLLAALQRHIVQGVVISPPFSFEAQAKGFRSLLDGISLKLPYAGSAVAARRSYVAAHRATVVAFLKGFVAAWRYLGDPANAASVERIIERHSKAAPAQAQQSYRYFLPMWQSETAPLIDPQGVTTALRYLANPKAKRLDPATTYDSSLLAAATG